MALLAILVSYFQKLLVNLRTTCWIEHGGEPMGDFRLAFTWPPGLGPEVPAGPQLVEELVRLIKRAKYTIDLYCYKINSSESFVLAQALNEAVRTRDVKLRIFCNKRSEGRRIIDTFGGEKGSIKAWAWSDLENPMSKFHIKAIVTDQRNVYLGSANMSETAMFSSAECGVFGANPALARQLSDYVDLLINSGNLEVIQ
jgi:phosphatidylserine/phosphatidylglycerophosphate/cardiolipin synthase-like enzyme